METDNLIGVFIAISYCILNNRREQFFYFIFLLSFALNYNKIIQLFKDKSIIRVILRLVIVYFAAYFLIKDPNPFYHLFFFFLPFPNYFRGIFILVFTSYFLTNKEYFFSKIFSNLTIKRVLLAIIGLSLLSFITYLYDEKLFVYIMPKQATLNKKKYYIATNLYNVEGILPDWINEMKKLISYIGPENVYFSVYENGDSKDKTPQMLLEFGAYLTSMKVPNRIGVDKVVNKTAFERIEFLSILRNRALDFLYELPDVDYENTKIIFFNDIIFSYESIIKLIMTNDHDYDAVCGMDFYESFYDVWATLGIDIQYPRYYYPYFVNKVAQDRYINGEPIRTFSCWNGVAVFRSLPFKDKQVEFRYGVVIRQSECLLAIRDMYVLGYKKVMINTRVKVAYEYYYYYMNKYAYPWCKNPFTYFYYYFKHLFVENLNSLGNMQDNDIEMHPKFQYAIDNLFFKPNPEDQKLNKPAVSRDNVQI